MAEKYLTQAEWKSASKGTAWKADPLTKALAAFEKAEKENPAAALTALAEVEKQADALTKANKGDKTLSAFVGDMTKAATRRRAELQKEQKEAEAAEQEGDEEGGDDALIDPKKLLTALNLLKRDAAARMNFSTVDSKDDKPPMFALSRKQAPKKLFTKLQDLAGTKVGSFGQAWLDGQVLILQVENKPMAGLTKKLRVPIKACGFRVAKIVLWDASGAVLEESADEAAAAIVGDGQAVPEAPPQPAQAADPQRTAFEQKLAELIPKVQAALASAHPAAAKLREVLGFAREKAQAAQFAAAVQALGALQALLAAPPAAGAAAAAAAPAEAGVPPRGDYVRCSKAWVATRTKLVGDVAKLRDAILAEYKGSPLLPEISSKVGKLDQMVARFDDKLAAVLDQAQAAADEAARIQLHREAAASIKRMLAQLDNDPILSRLADNPFLPIDPRSALSATLQVLVKQVP